MRESTEKLNKQYIRLVDNIIHIENIINAVVGSGIGEFQIRLTNFNKT